MVDIAHIRFTIQHNINLKNPYDKGPQTNNPAFVATGLADQSVDKKRANEPDLRERGLRCLLSIDWF